MPSASRCLLILSKGVRTSACPARTSSRPSMNRVLSRHSGWSSGWKVTKSRAVTRYALSPAARALRMECGRLARAGIAQQHVGGYRPEIAKRPGRSTFRSHVRDLRACSVYDGAHAGLNHSSEGTERNSLTGIPLSPTSSDPWGLKRRSNSLRPADEDPRFLPALDFNGDETGTLLDNEIDFKGPVPPVIEAHVNRRGIQ